MLIVFLFFRDSPHSQETTPINLTLTEQNVIFAYVDYLLLTDSLKTVNYSDVYNTNKHLLGTCYSRRFIVTLTECVNYLVSKKRLQLRSLQLRCKPDYELIINGKSELDNLEDKNWQPLLKFYENSTQLKAEHETTYRYEHIALINNMQLPNEVINFESAVAFMQNLEAKKISAHVKTKPDFNIKQVTDIINETEPMATTFRCVQEFENLYKNYGEYIAHSYMRHPTTKLLLKLQQDLEMSLTIPPSITNTVMEAISWILLREVREK